MWGFGGLETCDAACVRVNVTRRAVQGGEEPTAVSSFRNLTFVPLKGLRGRGGGGELSKSAQQGSRGLLKLDLRPRPVSFGISCASQGTRIAKTSVDLTPVLNHNDRIRSCTVCVHLS